jgi:toxin ParE1/3/4
VNLPFSIHPAATRELQQAADYYELVRAGLGHAFLDEIERAFERIRQYPEAAPLVEGTVRKATVHHRFPYSVMYSVRPSGIRILAIAHQRRRPLYWRSRR